MDIEYIKYKDTHLVYNDGRVYSLKSKKFLKFDYSNSDYARVTLNGKHVRVHRLVMELFKGYSELTVDHIDGNKRNNRLDNLEYVTTQENTRRYYDKLKARPYMNHSLKSLIKKKDKIEIELKKIEQEIKIKEK